MEGHSISMALTQMTDDRLREIENINIVGGPKALHHSA
jgi:hypothetical protein